MKILFINNGTTHYYNLVLNKLSQVPGIDLKLLVPSQVSKNIGEGVYQTREGIRFPVLELPEYRMAGIYSSFRGLAGLLLREKPDIIITADTYLYSFLFNLPVVVVKRLLGSKLILKSIPFRVPRYHEADEAIRTSNASIERFPNWFNTLLLQSGMLKLIRRKLLFLQKTAFRLPDAHVNYIDDAFDILGSYGVPRERIFITRNSPDTDMLLAVRASIESVAPILPPCKHRLVHVGRLVAWKHVDMLLRAFARLKKDFSDSELLIIGMGPEEDRLKVLSRHLGISSSVRFLGGIYDPSLLGQYLKASSVYVLAGMGGLSINEAMCFGLPIICSVGDGTEKVLVRDGVNGKYFADGDEDDLVRKISDLFHDPVLLKEMGDHSSKIIRDEINIHTVINGYLRSFAWLYPPSATNTAKASLRSKL